MKDIDFDELDRAVSSVLSKSTPADSLTTAPVEPSSNAPTTRVSAPTHISDVPETTPGPAPTAASPITLRPRGKFMDVIHPSADMNPAASVSARPAFSAPRTLAPLTARTIDQLEPTATVDEANALIGAEPAPVEVLSTNDEPEEILLLPAETDDEPTDTKDESATALGSNYVDPLDVAVETSVAATKEAPRQENIPQTTPFLSDTKVDKRPLGAFGNADEQGPEAPTNVTDDTQTAPVVPLPRELQPDVVQIESVQEADHTVAASSNKPFAASVGVDSDDTDDGRVEGHPLFDTSTYHEPIAAVHAKKTAPWVFWIVGLGICLVIGAGVGYFLFTAGL